MSSKYLKKIAATPIPQTEKLRADQVKNEAGGFVWEVDEFTRLRRFLILGSEGGSHYTSEQDLTKQNIQSLEIALAKDGKRFVTEVCDVSIKGRAPKQGPTLFALALACSKGDEPTRALALGQLGTVCRIPTHLFEFLNYVQLWRGWGPALKKAVARWYTCMDTDDLAYQVVKYREREGWTHRDVFRQAHPKLPHTHSANHPLGDVFRWIAKGYEAERSYPGVIEGFEELRKATTAKDAAVLIRKYKLPRECVPTPFLKEPLIWEALLDSMPLMAMIRNLGNMSKCGLVVTGSVAAKTISERLGDAEKIRKARVHPMALLIALKTYAQGHGHMGKGVWHAAPRVIDALDAAFYLAFPNVEPTNQRLLYAVDVSGSMCGGEVAGSPLTPREAAAALALVALNTEPNAEVVGFSDCVYDLGLSKRQRLDDVVQRITGLHNAAGTDCSLPVLYASQESRNFDGFVNLTDNQTWAGPIHVSEALKIYRKLHVQKARQVNVAMVANGVTIGDPIDPGTMDCVGFDTATPELVATFLRGEI